MFSISLSALVFTYLISHFWGHAVSQQLAAWDTDAGLQIFRQNETSGDMMYSWNGGSGFTEFRKVELSFAMMANSPISGSGYQNPGSGAVFATVFYITKSIKIAEAYMACTPSTGVCVTQGNYIVSDGATTGVNASTGLAVASMGSAGLRVFYHDDVAAVRELTYVGGNITWADGYLVSNDTGTATPGGGWGLGVAVNNTSNLTVVEVKGPIVQVLTRKQLNPWVPVANLTLENFNASSANIAAIVDNPGETFRLFYIGNDSRIHHYQSTDDAKNWTMVAQQDSSIWPTADTPNGNFAVTALKGKVTLFYTSDGDIVQASMTSGTWEKATVAVDFASEPTSTTSHSGSGNGVKIGAGVGVPLGVALIGLASWLIWRQRRKARNGTPAEIMSLANNGTNNETPAEIMTSPMTEPHKVPEKLVVSKTSQHEMADNYPTYELGDSSPAYELHAGDPPYPPTAPSRVQ